MASVTPALYPPPHSSTVTSTLLSSSSIASSISSSIHSSVTVSTTSSTPSSYWNYTTNPITTAPANITTAPFTNSTQIIPVTHVVTTTNAQNSVITQIPGHGQTNTGVPQVITNAGARQGFSFCALEAFVALVAVFGIL